MRDRSEEAGVGEEGVTLGVFRGDSERGEGGRDGGAHPVPVRARFDQHGDGDAASSPFDLS